MTFNGNALTVGVSQTNSGGCATIAGGGLSNIGLGALHSYIGGGACNTINASAACSVLAGGFQNIICTSHTFNTIGGGRNNVIDNDCVTIAGGHNNTASGLGSTIGGGGLNNNGGGNYITIAGGCCNVGAADTGFSFIGGGLSNQVNGSGGAYAVIGGGLTNCALGPYSTVVGGRGNSHTGDYSGILGGRYNTGSGTHDDSFIIGSNITTQGSCTTFVNNLAYYAYGNTTTYLGTSQAAGEIIYVGNTSTTAGNIYFLTGSAGTPSWTAANAKSVNTSTKMLAMAVGSNSNADGMLIRGYARYTTQFSMTGERPGDPCYLSDNAFVDGLMIFNPPSNSGDVVRIVGYVIDATDEIMYFDPDKSWVEIA